MKAAWKTVKLADVVQVASGQVDPTVPPYCDMLHVGGDNIESNTGGLHDLRTAKELNLISGKYPFDERDVLYSKIRPALNKVVAPDFKGICSADIYPIRPLNGELCREYLIYLLRSKDFYDYAGRHSTRTNIPKINRVALLAYEACLPPLREQRRIAAMLDKADAIRRKREEGIRLTEELLRSTFLEMFGKGKSQRIKLSEVVYFQEGPGVRNWQFMTAGIKLLNVRNLVDGKLDLSNTDRFLCKEEALGRYKHFLLDPDDLVMASSGATWGKTAWARHEHLPLCLNTSTIRFRPKGNANLSRQFMRAFLDSDDFRRQIQRIITGSAQPNFGPSHLEAVDMPIPEFAEQMKFDQIARSLSEMATKRKKAECEAALLFGALVQRASRGEL